MVERDDTGNGGAEIGTLSEVVTRYGSWADHDVTVCGSPAMIRSTVSQMLVAGTPLDRITLRPVHPRLTGAGRATPTVRPRRWPTPGPRRRVVGCRVIGCGGGEARSGGTDDDVQHEHDA